MSSAMSRAFVTLLFLVCAGPRSPAPELRATASHAGQDTLGSKSAGPLMERVIEADLKVRLPPAPCDVAARVQGIARAVGAPSGAEFLPGSCEYEHLTYDESQEPVALRGLTVEEALNRLIEIDPRYRWQERDGVIVIRPASAWQNAGHFLHRTIEAFELEDRNVPDAQGALRVTFGEPPSPGLSGLGNKSPDAGKTFSLALGPTPAIDLLNAVVRTHGRLHWEMEYCGPAARPENAKLWLTTTDNGLRAGSPHHAAPRSCR